MLAEALSGFDEVWRLEAQLERLAADMAGPEADPALLDRYGEVQHRFEALGGYRLEAQAKVILSGLGFKPEEVHRPLARILRRMAHARGAGAPAPAPPGPPAARRADQSPGSRVARVAGELPRLLRRQRGARLPRPLFPEPHGDGDRRPGRGHVSPSTPATTIISSSSARPGTRCSRRARATRPSAWPRSSASSTASAIRRRRRARSRAGSRCSTRWIGSRSTRALGGFISSFPSPRARGGWSPASPTSTRPMETRSCTGARTSPSSAASAWRSSGVNGAGKSTLLKVLAGTLALRQRRAGPRHSRRGALLRAAPARRARSEPDGARRARAGGSRLDHRAPAQYPRLLSLQRRHGRQAHLRAVGRREGAGGARQDARPSRPRSCAWTSRPTTSTSRRRKCSRRRCRPSPGPSCSSPTTATSSTGSRRRWSRWTTATLTTYLGSYDDYLAHKAGAAAPPPPVSAPPVPAPPPAPARLGSSPAAPRGDRRERKEIGREVKAIEARLRTVETQIHDLEARLEDTGLALADPELYRDSRRAREIAQTRKETEERVARLMKEWEDLSLQLSSVKEDA